LAELLDEGSVTLIEWGDTIASALPRDYLEVSITFGDAPDDRVLELRPVGPQWQARSRALSIALAAWVAPTDAPDADDELAPGEDGAGAC
jgi:hypothetical protein